jgi:integrase
MKGWIVKRHRGSWSIVLDLGYQVNPTTGLKRRRQKWITYTPPVGTPRKRAKELAKEKLTALLHASNTGTYVEPSKLTVASWLTTWLTESVKPARSKATYRLYETTIRVHLIPGLGQIPLQQLRPGQVQAYYANVQRTRGRNASRTTLSPKTLALHQAILSGAMQSAVKQDLVTRNIIPLVEGRTEVKPAREEAKKCWTLDEAQRFLTAAKAAGPQLAALFASALDTGARLGELCGLRWTDIDLDGGAVTIDRQLLESKPTPVFGPTKTGQARRINLNSETIRLLRDHKRSQAELKLKNRLQYRDLGLVFCQEWDHVRSRTDALGLPLHKGRLGPGALKPIATAAGVRVVRFHALRHTVATLMLSAGTPVHVVAERLGHASATQTLDTYAHVLPADQHQATQQLGALLHTGAWKMANRTANRLEKTRRNETLQRPPEQAGFTNESGRERTRGNVIRSGSVTRL